MIDLEEPDKGRAWVIAIAACIINMILSGLSRMIGILYVAVIDAYGVTRQEATLPFTVRNAIRCLSGPLVGIIGQRFGIRAVTFFGGVVASTGAALCCIAPSIFWLAVCWGGIHGFGFAFANTLFQVLVNQYFHKYRATASGIALSGACVGSLGFPVIIEWILDTFGLSGGFLILAGIVMHVLPPSLLLSAPQWIKYPKAYARLWSLMNSNAASIETLDTSVIVPGDHSTEEVDKKVGRKFARSTSMDNNPMESMGVCSASREKLHKENKNGVVIDHLEGLDNSRTIKNADNAVTCTLYNVQESPLSERRAEMQNSATKHLSVINTISDKVQNDPNNQPEHPKPPTKTTVARNQNTQSIAQSLRSIGHLYTNPVYVLISVCMSTYILIFIPILTVLVDYSKDKGISELYGKYLINAMAIGDLIGRLGFGWVTDKKLMTVPCFMCLVQALQGLFIALFPFASSLTTFMALLVLYGVTAGSILVLFPVLVLQYVDTNAQSVAMACVGFLSGIMSFAIPPMIGHFRDEVGSYDGMFYLTGIISVVSGGMWLLEPVVVKYYYGKKDERAVETERNNMNAIPNNHRETSNDQNKNVSS